LLVEFTPKAGILSLFGWHFSGLVI
jgi:hypothetical protein